MQRDMYNAIKFDYINFKIIRSCLLDCNVLALSFNLRITAMLLVCDVLIVGNLKGFLFLANNRYKLIMIGAVIFDATERLPKSPIRVAMADAMPAFDEYECVHIFGRHCS